MGSTSTPDKEEKRKIERYFNVRSFSPILALGLLYITHLLTCDQDDQKLYSLITLFYKGQSYEILRSMRLISIHIHGGFHIHPQQT